MIKFQHDFFLERLSFRYIWRKYHIFMYFFEKDHLSFSVQRIRSYFRQKGISSFQIIQERSYSSRFFFGKTIFSEYLKKISYFHVFFWEKSSFIFHLKNKMIFRRKRNVIFPDNLSVSAHFFLERLSFRNIWKNLIIWNGLFRSILLYHGKLYPQK